MEFSWRIQSADRSDHIRLQSLGFWVFDWLTGAAAAAAAADDDDDTGAAGDWKMSARRSTLEEGAACGADGN